MTKQTDKLSILYSCRIRLNDEQRQKLKQAYYATQAANAIPEGARIGSSQVSTVTAAAPAIQRQLPGIVISDLLGTRETIPLTTIVQLERAFGTQVLSREDLIKAAEGYIDYVLSSND